MTRVGRARSIVASPRREIGRLWPGHRNVVAGLLDAGLASLATFAVGVYAVRELDPAVLGAYALVYQLVFLVGIIPANLVFVPVESAVVALDPARRFTHLPRSLALGAAPAALSGLVVAGWLLVLPRGIPDDAVLALTTTGIGLAMLSPVQDHVRRLLHSAGLSSRAAWTSAVQLGVVVVALVAAAPLGVGAAWLPLGALALANLVSLTVGVAARRGAPREAHLDLRFGELARGGHWLVWGGLVNPASGFVAAVLVSHLAGAAALGYAEAARVIAQPIWVLAVGVSSVLGPRSMEAGHRRQPEAARKISRAFLAAIAAAGAVNLVWFGMAWSLNPLSWLMPAAFVVTGLVPATILAQILNATIFPLRSELIGARREADYTRSEIIGGAARSLVSVSAIWIHAFAMPLGWAAVGLVRWLLFRGILQRVYREPAPAGARL